MRLIAPGASEVGSDPGPGSGSELASDMDEIRRRNWITISAATVVMMFSYFTYGAAFVEGTGDSVGFEPRLAAIGLTLAPFVFVVLAFGSRNPHAPRDVLRAMGLFLVVAIAVALIDPLLGAATGFAAGGAIALRRPKVERVASWRLGAVALIAAYCFALLVFAPPAGVFSGAIVPLMMVAFADEFAAYDDTST